MKGIYMFIINLAFVAIYICSNRNRFLEKQESSFRKKQLIEINLDKNFQSVVRNNGSK